MNECKKQSTCEFCRDFETCKKPEKGLKHNEWALSNRMAKIKKKIMVMSTRVALVRAR